MNDIMVDKATMISLMNDLDNPDNVLRLDYLAYTPTDPKLENKWFKEYLVVSFKDGAKTIRDITSFTKGETRRIVHMIIGGVDHNDPKTNAILPTEEDGWVLVK